MPKNVVFCADGTWNGPGGDDNDTSPPSNVWKLFLHLDGQLDPDTLLLAAEQEKTLSGPNGQVSKYLHGVGSSSALIDRVFGGVFGNGTIERIVRGYTFVSRNYEPGDRIFLLGFSRGAYTARALGGLLVDMGLLNREKYDLTDKALAYRLGGMAWREHRAKRVATRANSTDNLGLLSKFVDVIDALPHFMSGNLAVDDLSPLKDGIQAIAVWDTVGSLGIPAYVDDSDERVDVFRFADTDLSPNVQIGLHAISLDEQREDFVPTLWTPRDGVTQVVFPGAHSDVGGGYPPNESGLSNGALNWMVARLKALGIGFQAGPPLIAGQADGTAHRPWETGVFRLRRHAPRTMLASDNVQNRLGFHTSLQKRLNAPRAIWDPDDGTAIYAPTVLAAAIKGNQNWEGP